MVERIRTLLESRQLTPTQFADLIGVARPTVSHILSGRNKPSLEVVQRILAAMPELAIPWLLNGSEPMLAATGGRARDAAPTPVQPTRSDAVPVPEPVEVPQLPKTQQLVPPAAAPAMSKQPTDALDAGRVAPARTAEGPTDRASKPADFKPVAPLKRFVSNTLPTPKPAELPPLAAHKPIAVAQERVLPPNGLGSAAADYHVPAAPVPLTALPVTDAPAPVSNALGAASPASESAMADAFFAGTEKPIRRIVIFYRDGSFADYQPE